MLTEYKICSMKRKTSETRLQALHISLLKLISVTHFIIIMKNIKINIYNKVILILLIKNNINKKKYIFHFVFKLKKIY